MKNILSTKILPVILALGIFAASFTACTPTVKLEAPDKPIEINMNVKIEQEVRVRVERDLDEKILSHPDLFGIPQGKK